MNAAEFDSIPVTRGIRAPWVGLGNLAGNGGSVHFLSKLPGNQPSGGIGGANDWPIVTNYPGDTEI